MFKEWIWIERSELPERQDPKGDRYRCLTKLLHKMKKSKETDIQEISSTDPSVSRTDNHQPFHATLNHIYLMN
jgi:hypothetical protein